MDSNEECLVGREHRSDCRLVDWKDIGYSDNSNWFTRLFGSYAQKRCIETITQLRCDTHNITYIRRNMYWYNSGYDWEETNEWYKKCERKPDD